MAAGGALGSILNIKNSEMLLDDFDLELFLKAVKNLPTMPTPITLSMFS
jgi:hypothetical protein